MRASALEEFDSEIMQPCCEVHEIGPFCHAVTAVVLNETLAVEPQFRTVVRIDEQCPVAGKGDVDEAAEPSPPMLFEPVIQSLVGIVRGAVIEVGLNLYAIGFAVDERRHRGRVK